MMLDRTLAISQMNQLGAAKVPFFFFTDFRGHRAWIKPLSEISEHELQYDFSHIHQAENPGFSFHKAPVSQEEFSKAFRYVVDQINLGYSYLVNLTFRHRIRTSLTLPEIFATSKAMYKVLYGDQFVVFSPETFVKIEAGHIFSYPMKGTIDAALPGAAAAILADPKETAEHVTIVDLIRNDLSRIATQVEVTRFRFLSEISTHEKKLLQVSSEIRGRLPEDYLRQLGHILFQLLPAGSVSGAPKGETLRIIEAAETYDRGFYTGICGLFDGSRLDSGVMIRFIEKEGTELYYKSGGGITSFSDEQKEYQEIVDKIYIPVS